MNEVSPKRIAHSGISRGLRYEAQVGSLLLHNSLRERSWPDVQVMHFTHDYRSFRNVLGPIQKEWTTDTIDMHKIVDRTENLFLVPLPARAPPHPVTKNDYAADRQWCISGVSLSLSGYLLGPFRSVL